MADSWKPKPVKNLAIKHKDKIYDKITYLSCSNNGVHFENMDSESVTTNINCKLEDIEIVTNKGE